MTARARKPTDVGKVLRWVLAAQIAFAAILLGSDLSRILPTLFSPSDAPALTNPIGPGDQTRRYAPARLPMRAPQPGTRPIPSTTDMPSRLEMNVTNWNGNPVLTLTGTIAPGDAARFTEFLTTVDPAPVSVFLNSPGGSVSDALAIGRDLRARDVATALTETDVCLSACPYLLAAGTTRTVADKAIVGVHQHFFDKNMTLPAFLAVEDIQRGQGAVMAYLNDMGIDPLIMQHALVTPPDEIYVLTPGELSLYNLTTEASE